MNTTTNASRSEANRRNREIRREVNREMTWFTVKLVAGFVAFVGLMLAAGAMQQHSYCTNPDTAVLYTYCK